MTPWDRFAAVARGQKTDRVPVACIVDSPWLPGYAGIDTLDYFLKPDEWLRINLGLLERFPDVAWIPGFWVEYGMAAEPSVFGARVAWSHDAPPSIEPVPGGMAAVVNLDPPDPHTSGLMPLVLQLYADAERKLEREGLGIKMVCARGPMAVGGWMLGVSDFLLALMTEPETAHRFIDLVTTTIISWLRAQAEVLRAPEGIMLLDDIVGMISPQTFDEFARPYLTRIFEAFPGQIKVFHNDTPCPRLVEPMSTVGFDVFNFSHKMDIGTVQAQMPNVALMGNVPPLDLMVRGTPEQVEAWALECVRKTGGRGLILSPGGGVSPGTRAECIDALARVAKASTSQG